MNFQMQTLKYFYGMLRLSYKTNLNIGEIWSDQISVRKGPIRTDFATMNIMLGIITEGSLM
jgi:hypothetical protein